MNELAHGMLVTLIPALFVAIITAYLTVRLSLRQFYSQKWWEKKAEVYSQIINQLSDMQYSYRYWLEDLEDGCLALNEQAINKLRIDYENARENLKRISGIGAYIISDDAAIEIKKLLFALEVVYVSEDELAQKSAEAEAVKAAIQAIKSCAAKDLRK